MLRHIAEVGAWTVNGYPGAVVLVVNPNRDGINFEAGPRIDVDWLEDAIEDGFIEWDDPAKTPADGSHAFFGSGSCGYADGTHRDIRVTDKGRQLLTGRDAKRKACDCRTNAKATIG
jgi:hypothetical protein